MRVAIFQDTTRPKVDGVVISTELFMRELKRQGHEVLLVVPRFPGQECGEDMYQVDSVNGEFLYPKTRLGKFWQTKPLKKRLDAFQPDLVHSMTEFAIGHLMCTAIRNHYDVPRVHTFHTLWNEYLCYLPLVPDWLVNAWMRWAAPRTVRKRANALIAPSVEMRDTIMNEWNVGEFPIAVVPTGIELDRFAHMDGAAFRAARGIRPDEKVVLYLGRMGDEKNVELVVRTMRKLRDRGVPDLRFVIAGGGPAPYMKRLKKLAAELGLDDIIWTGFVKDQAWLNCYGAADLFLFPSVTETQGLVVVESLAAGVPMVSVKAMGPKNTMAGEQGCLWGDNDPDDFAEKAERLLTDEALYAEKKKQAAQVASRYSIEARAKDLVEVYDCAVAGRALPPGLTGQPQLEAGSV